MPNIYPLHSSMLFSNRTRSRLSATIKCTGRRIHLLYISNNCRTHSALPSLSDYTFCFRIRSSLISPLDSFSQANLKTHDHSSTEMGSLTNFSSDSSIVFDRFRSLDVMWHYVFWLVIYASMVTGTWDSRCCSCISISCSISIS